MNKKIKVLLMIVTLIFIITSNKTLANEISNKLYVVFDVEEEKHNIEHITINTENGKDFMIKGKKIQFQAYIYPENATNKDVLWIVDNNNVANIDVTTGLLTALNYGEVNVKAFALDGSGISGEMKIIIYNRAISIDINYKGVQGEQDNYGIEYYTNTNYRASDNSLRWISSNVCYTYIKFEPGTYKTMASLDGGVGNIVIRGAGPNKTIINGKVGGMGANSLIENITFRAPAGNVECAIKYYPSGPSAFRYLVFDGYEVGIENVAMNSVIDHCTFISNKVSNKALTWSGINNKSTVTITNSIFGGRGNGLSPFWGLEPDINSLIYNNAFNGYSVGYPHNNEANIDGNLFIDLNLNPDYSLPCDSILLHAGIDGWFIGAVSP